MSSNKNVWLARLYNYNLVNHFTMYSVNSQKYDFAQHWKILESLEKTDDAELLELKKQYKSETSELSQASRYFFKTKYLPDSLWVENCDMPLPTPSDYIFQINSGGILFNQPLTDLLQQFRLGETTLTPLQIYNLETQQRCSEETFYFLNLCERREYICKPQPDDMFKPVLIDEKNIKYYPHGDIEDGQLLVNRAVLDCDLDLWHDPLLNRVFVSDALHDALLQADFATKWDMVSCQLV